MTAPAYLLPDGSVPVLISASDSDLVRDEAGALHRYAAGRPAVTPQQIAGMLFRTRTARPHRALAMVRGRDDLLDAWAAIADGRDHPAVIRTSAPAAARGIGYVFPGQGGQRPGMARLFYDSVPAFRAEADRCADAFRQQLGGSPLDYLLDEEFPADDTARVVQPALFVQMAALAAMWRSFGVGATAVVGHSQGEIAAAYCAGATTLADAARVVAIRARAVDELATGDYAMAVVAADRDCCEDLIARAMGWAELSVVNSPNMTGISGERGAVQQIVDTLAARGVFARVIGVRYPAHTSWVSQLAGRVRGELRRELHDPMLSDTDIAWLGGTFGGKAASAGSAGSAGSACSAEQYWFANLRNTVRFDKAVAAAASLGVDTFVELAVHPALQLAIGENLAGDPAARVVGTSHRAAADLGDFTANLMQIAVSDLEYPWEYLHSGADTGPPPLPLADFPNTRMNEVCLWLPYNATADPPAPAPPAQPAPAAPAARPRLLAEQWIRLPQRTLVPPRAIGIVDHTAACSDVVAALGRAAADLGTTARAVDGDTAGVDTCVVLVPRSAQPDFEAAAGAVSAFFSDRRWWPEPIDPVGECWLVTAGGEEVAAGDTPPDPVSAAAAAGFRAIRAEYPRVAFRHLDLPTGLTAPDAATAILSALHTEGESEMAVRGGGWYAKRVVECDAPPADTGPAPEHVLIVGGTGNLGLEFCEYFTGRGARRITLLSRSGGSAAADRLRRIRSATPARVDAVRCDIGDPAALSALAEQYRDTPADVVVHAALSYADMDLHEITAERADDLLRAKVVGAWRVLQTFPRTQNCRVVLCSSVAATIGGRGQIGYAAANRMLDAMALRLRADGQDCVSVQWGRWTAHFDLDPAGWAKLAATGLLPMRPADALAVGMAGLDRNRIVAAFDLARARPVLDSLGYGPLLSALTAAQPEMPVADTAADSGDPGPRLLQLAAETIGAAAADGIDAAAPMVSIGLDSLQALEFHRRVKAEFGHDLPLSDLLGGASLADVLGRLGGRAG